MQMRVIVKKNRLPHLLSNIDKAAKETVEEFSEGVLLPEGKRQQSPHIDTGALNASGVVTLSGMSALLVFSGGASGRVDGLPRVYAAYHEYGTRVTGEYPFMRPAIEAVFPDKVYPIAKKNIMRYT